MESREPIPIAAAVYDWLEHNRQFAKGTQKIYRRTIKNFVDFLEFQPEAITTIDHITPSHIQKFHAETLEKGVSRRTANISLTTTKSFCRWLTETYCIDSPAENVKYFKEDAPHRRFIEPDEFDKILAVCDREEKRIIQLLRCTGLRAFELQAVYLENISDNLKWLSVNGKGRKKRKIPLCETARRCLIRNDKPDIEFLDRYRKRNALYYLCLRLCRRAKIKPPLTPHSFRRYFGCCLLKKNVNLYHISKLYGHGSVVVTEKYLSASTADLENICDVLD